jgi:glycosyltransferase involved in cell wall biosynthesis
MSPNLPRVGIISDRVFPCNQADTQQIVKNASALARSGLHVELVVPRQREWAFRPRGERLRELSDYYHLESAAEITQLLSLPAGDLRAPVKVVHGVAAPLYLAARRFDVAYSRNIFPGLLCLSLGLRVVYESYRAWGDEHPRLVAAAGLLARHPRFVGLITHSHYAAESLCRSGFPADRVLVAHCGFDPADMEPRLSREAARAAIGRPTGGRLVVYAGNLEPIQDIESILEVASLLPEVDFLLVGGHPGDVSRLTAHADRVGAGNVALAGHRPVAEVARYLYAADVLVIPPSSRPLRVHHRTVLPLKTFSYLAAGRPILAPDLPDSGELLTAQNALLVKPDDPVGTARALRALLDDPPRADRLAAAARDTSQRLTWDARAERIRDWLVQRIGA